LYDVAVIGAGINGCAVSYHLSQSGKKVVLFDREGVAAGGSGAAGAFISPKFSKGGELKELMDKAYVYSLAFYNKRFSSYIINAPLLHICKYDDEAEKLIAFKQNSSFSIAPPPFNILQNLTQDAQTKENVYLANSGVVDAQGVCKAMIEGIDFFCTEIDSLIYKDGYYEFGDIKAKEVVLADGAYKPLIEEPYINLRGIWGHRIDITTSTRTEVTMHHHVSIAKCDDGVMAIGATHDVHYHPQKNQEPYDIDAGRAELLQKAGLTLELRDVKVLRDYTGLRCGSNDYLPLVGRVIQSSDGEYYPHLYMINGVGGYGFVLAPYIAKLLAESIINGTQIDTVLDPKRFYRRWQKKSLS
jgi:tRNA 5-methylaminomethyl-2-thiouridine biosynthesis bifunctional protein